MSAPPHAAASPDATDDLTGRVQAFAADTLERLTDVTHGVADQAARLADTSGQYVRENPGPTLGGAFAVGIAVGFLFGRR